MHNHSNHDSVTPPVNLRYEVRRQIKLPTLTIHIYIYIYAYGTIENLLNFGLVKDRCKTGDAGPGYESRGFGGKGGGRGSGIGDGDHALPGFVVPQIGR